MLFLLKYNTFLKITFLVSFFSIATSLVLENILEMVPCKLCLMVRYLWIVYFSFSFIGLIGIFKNNYFILYVLLIFSFLIALLSFYHTGIENGFFANVLNCSANISSNPLSIEELDSLIRNTKFSDCSIPAGYIFNLSYSTWSSLLAFLLLIYSLTTLIINTTSKV